YDMTQSHFYQSREVKFKQFIFDQFMVQVCFLGEAPWGYKKVSVFQLLSS
ncbi:4'-phosphopantetheinyl transferase, partial [Staphylococcus aureus]|nr:4'-phosphopantetheinyl transferase [Staphylococcus aureus]